MSTRALRPDHKDRIPISKALFKHQLIATDTTAIEIEQFTNGYSNLTYLIKADQQEWVLRRPPLGAIKRGHDMGREYKVLSGLFPSFKKVPKPLFFEADAQYLGAPFYVMSRVEGTILTYQKAKELSLPCKAYTKISNTWIDSLVELHQLDYKEIGLEDLGRPEGYVERQVKNWSKQYLKAATLELSTSDFVMTWLHENQPKNYDHSIIHNDYKYDNVVFANNNWTELKAILDWEMCTLGDPLMDLGTSLGYWTMQEDDPLFQKTLPSPTVLKGNPKRSEIVESYTRKSGRPINNLIFYYAFGLFKIAVIAQQIFYRYSQGYTDNPKFKNLDKVCAFLLQTAQQSIQKKRIESLY